MGIVSASNTAYNANQLKFNRLAFFSFAVYATKKMSSYSNTELTCNYSQSIFV